MAFNVYFNAINHHQTQTMKFNVTLDRDEGATRSIEFPSIPGCVSQRKAKAETPENMKDAIVVTHDTPDTSVR
jgi:predicted RNase H-like HicB family nuclease